MKIFYRQPKDDFCGVLSRMGIQDCYFKELVLANKQDNTTNKKHYHTSFELHMVKDGFQEYEIGDSVYRIEGGSFLLIYPNTPHRAVMSAPNSLKYSITFSKKTDDVKTYFFEKIPNRVMDNISFIAAEVGNKKEISTILIENSILEILVAIFRMLGMKENDDREKEKGNAMIALAKQYIDDNVTSALGVADVAAYCYLSTKQLTRLFKKFENISPGEYIIKNRVERIEAFLADSAFSLKQISAKMNFENEYYFNAFFKKHSGMPPGEYRKMLGQ